MIGVRQDPDKEAVEHCCFCRAKTSYWYTPRDVACCQLCAAYALAKDIPTKKEWMRKEAIASHNAAWVMAHRR